MNAIHTPTPIMEFTEIDFDINDMKLQPGDIIVTQSVSTDIDAGDEFAPKCVRIFDDAVEEVMTLLKRDPLVRFYNTKDYESLAGNMR